MYQAKSFRIEFKPVAGTNAMIPHGIWGGRQIPDGWAVKDVLLPVYMTPEEWLKKNHAFRLKKFFTAAALAGFNPLLLGKREAWRLMEMNSRDLLVCLAILARSDCRATRRDKNQLLGWLGRETNRFASPFPPTQWEFFINDRVKMQAEALHQSVFAPETNLIPTVLPEWIERNVNFHARHFTARETTAA